MREKKKNCEHALSDRKGETGVVDLEYVYAIPDYLFYKNEGETVRAKNDFY